jgi:hypothetical protein
MPFSETERENAPQFPHAHDSSSHKTAETSLAFSAELPHLQKLLSRQDAGAAGNPLPQFDFSLRRHACPWGTPTERANPGAESAQEKKTATAQKQDILPQLTLLDTGPRPASNQKTSEAAGTKAASDSKTVNTEKKEETSRPAVAKAAEPVPTACGGSWKQEGSQWNYYDRLGQKAQRYEGKVSGVTAGAEGNARIKLSDGRTITEKKDGSTLEFDKSNQLKSINYSDGTSRKFSWDGSELVGMSSKTGNWTRGRDAEGKLKNEWIPEGQSAGWQGEVKLDGSSAELAVGPTIYRTDLSVEKVNADGSREITQPNKDVVKVSKEGTISEVSLADGSNRKFTWQENPAARGADDKYILTGLQVHNNGKYYYHSRQENGKWTCQTWENGRWSDAQPEGLSFKMDNKTGDYTYTDSADGVSHVRRPGGLETAITADGARLEYKDGKLARVSREGVDREFDWQNDKLTAIRDGGQGKIWKPAAGGWESNTGEKRQGTAIISAAGEIEFKSGDKSTIVKMNGAEYSRIVNEKEGSQVDRRDGEVQVKAGDGSARVFITAADGREVVRESVTRNGKTESWTRAEKTAGGNYIWVMSEDPSRKQERVSVTQQDGKLSIEYADGRKYQADTAGNERMENQKEGWYTKYRDGHPVENKYPDGTIRKFSFDGPSDSPKSVEIVPADGSAHTTYTRVSEGVYSYKSGESTKQWNVDFTVSRDGNYKYVDKDDKGKTTSRRLDGHTIVEDPTDGSRIEKQGNEITRVVRGGKEVELIRDGNKAPLELRDFSSNTAYRKNESGQWLAAAIDPARPFNRLDDLSREGALSIDESGKVSFIADDGRQVSQKPGEKGELLTSKEKTLEECLKNDSLTDVQKDRLRRNVLEFCSRSDLPAKDKAIFQDSLVKIARRSDISEKEKADTYAQLGRLLESKSDRVFNSSQRAQLAQQLVWHIGNPQDNCQGANPNCQVTTIRGRLLYEKPAQFARMMTDVITTGNFVTRDGSTIKVPASSLKVGKGSEESTFPPEDGSRSWLGKISDVACCNIHWQRQSQTPRGESVPAGQLVYREDPPGARKDTGARIHREPGDGYMYPQTDVAGKLLSYPNLYSNDIADVYRQIAGPTNNVILGARRNELKAGQGVGLVNEEELHAVLANEKGVHIAQIWTGTDWVWDEPNRKHGVKPGSDSGHDEHVVLVKDYDPVTRTVAVDNSWSSMYDRVAGDRRITLHELYLAMSKQK